MESSTRRIVDECIRRVNKSNPHPILFKAKAYKRRFMREVRIELHSTGSLLKVSGKKDQTYLKIVSRITIPYYILEEDRNPKMTMIYALARLLLAFFQREGFSVEVAKQIIGLEPDWDAVREIEE